MNTLQSLINGRERPKTFSRILRVWGKRIVNFPGLIRLMWRANRLRVRGASVGAMSIIGEIEAIGKINLLSIGAKCALGRCSLAIFAELKIGKYVVINDSVRIMTASHDISCKKWSRIERSVVIEDYAWIATGAIILPGVTIGRGAVVGAGSVVSKSVPPGHLVIGNPARDMGMRRSIVLDYDPTELVAPYEAWLGPQENGGRYHE